MKFNPIERSEDRVRKHKENAIKELDLMHDAMLAGDFKKAMHHKIVANIAIDEMVNVSSLIEGSNGDSKPKQKETGNS